MTALTANLRPSLDADGRHRAQSRVRRRPKSPGSRTSGWPRSRRSRPIRAASPIARSARLIYGDAHPYGSVGGTGKAAVIEALTPEALADGAPPLAASRHRRASPWSAT